MNFTIQYNDLAAIALFQAKKDIRYYLNGVHITPDGLEATCGAILARISEPTGLDSQSLIIPSDTVKMILQSTNSKAPIVCVNGVVNNAITITPIDGTFPNTARVISTLPESQGEAGQFDPELLMQFKKASKLLGNCKIGTFELVHNGKGTALVKFPQDSRFIGAIAQWNILPVKQGGK